jgi:hypothetical protein
LSKRPREARANGSLGVSTAKDYRFWPLPSYSGTILLREVPQNCLFDYRLRFLIHDMNKDGEKDRVQYSLCLTTYQEITQFLGQKGCRWEFGQRRLGVQNETEIQRMQYLLPNKSSIVLIAARSVSVRTSDSTWLGGGILGCHGVFTRNFPKYRKF